MAISTQDGLVAALAGAQDIIMSKQAATSVAGFWHSLWDRAGIPGAGSLSIGNTSAGLVPDDTVAGSFPITDFTSGKTGYLGGFDANSSVTGAVRLYDRLFHVGSVLATSLATTTLASQPSYSGRLPGTNYSQVEVWLEVNVAISATATTVTVNYTNQAGTTGKTATLDTNISGLPSGRMVQLRLAAGDTGVQKIESITVGGTVASAGSFNIVVLRPIAEHNILTAGIAETRQDAFKTGLPVLYGTSCLALMFFPTGTSTGLVFADIDVIQG